MDAVTAFLHGRLEEEVYMKIPPYMKVDKTENKVLKTKGVLYGLKQGSHVWGKMFEAIMLKSGFKQCLIVRITLSSHWCSYSEYSYPTLVCF